MRNRKMVMYICLTILNSFILAGCSKEKVPAQPDAANDTVTNETVTTGTVTMVMGAYDWGPLVGRIILTLDTDICEIDKDVFQVTEQRQTGVGNSVEKFERIVSDVYLSDANGFPTNEPSKYITVDMQVQPDDFVFYWDVYLQWPSIHNFIVNLNEGHTLKGTDGPVEKLVVKMEPENMIAPAAEKFQDDTFTYEDITYCYSYYRPQPDEAKNPLVIWLHGFGEGGTDPSIVELGGSRVTALIEEDIQTKLGGAYILMPQCPTYWMDSGYQVETRDGNNIYTESLMALIRDYVSSNEDINHRRIYIGGCSNGGYMTMDMILNYPDYFAAAFPVCQAYYDDWISDEQIEAVKDIPIWFTHTEHDTTISPDRGTFKTYDRLLGVKAANARLSRFEDVQDTSGLYKDSDGKPFKYHPHCSWIYVLNDECVDEKTGETLFQWLAKQAK